MFGITSWRNIIPYYTLDGAVTEINAEAYFALEAAAMLAAVCERRSTTGRAMPAEATALREAMLAKLFNADTSAFVLNYDQDGNYQDNFTADEVFPVLFDVADETARIAILQRLLEPDFVTPVGLRTISTADSWYFPSHGFGLLGGVWPDLTLWFAVALARNGAHRHAVRFLESIYASMEAGTSRNTVPGQFGEWFDGGSLTNRGMYLSPWTGAKYLWAVAETVCGLDGYRTSGRLHLVPRVPPEWRWTCGRPGSLGRPAAHLRCGPRRQANHRRHAGARRLTSPIRSSLPAGTSATKPPSRPQEVAAIAFEAAGGGVRLFICNPFDRSRNVAVEFRGRMIRRHIEAGAMLELVLSGNPQLRDAMPLDAALPDGAPAHA